MERRSKVGGIRGGGQLLGLVCERLRAGLSQSGQVMI